MYSHQYTGHGDWYCSCNCLYNSLLGVRWSCMRTRPNHVYKGERLDEVLSLLARSLAYTYSLKAYVSTIFMKINKWTYGHRIMLCIYCIHARILIPMPPCVCVCQSESERQYVLYHIDSYWVPFHSKFLYYERFFFFFVVVAAVEFSFNKSHNSSNKA